MPRLPFSPELSLPDRLPGEKSGRWLDRALREAITTGQLKPGSRVPSSRLLGQQYGLARGTVMEVFAQLLAEGYLDSSHGSGTRVVDRLPETFFTPETASVNKKQAEAKINGRSKQRTLSPQGKLLLQSPFYGVIPAGKVRAFRAYQPAVDYFPVDLWAKLCGRKMRQVSREMLLHSSELGWPPLQKAIAAHLGSARGVICEPEQIMMVSGTQQALDFVCRLLLSPGDSAWVEDPCYPGATSILRAAGIRAAPVPVDDQGLQVTKGKRQAPQARLAYITPANQFPLGMTLPLERRLQLINWARESGAWIFEDDYDSEFRFVGRPLAAVQGLDPQGGVLFSSSFNKMLFPTLRMGVLVLPPSLVEAARRARSMLDRYPPLLEQLVLCDFIQEGHFHRHLCRMRQHYAERLDTLRSAVESMSDLITLGRCDTGLQTTAWLPDGADDKTIAQYLARKGLEVYPLSNYATRWPMKNGLHLGFGAVSPREIKQGVELLKKELPALLR